MYAFIRPCTLATALSIIFQTGIEAASYKPGLAGTYFKGNDFTRPDNDIDYLNGISHRWGDDKGNDWSARWTGFIESPISGNVTFTAHAYYGIRLMIDDTIVIDGIDTISKQSGIAALQQGKKHTITIEFIALDGKAELDLYWQWPGHEKSLIPASALSFDPALVGQTSYEGLSGGVENWPDIEIPTGSEHECVIDHIVVYDAPGRYAGWPANGGFWMWGNELAVAFECGWFKDRPDWMDGHARDDEKPNEDIIARSVDGGHTWNCQKYDILSGDDNLLPSPGGINFTHPDFALKCQGERFYFSYDRAKTWQGPFRLHVAELPTGNESLESRTCYLVEGNQECLLFMGVEPEGCEERSFCARTIDGGKTFEINGWITPPLNEIPNFERWVAYSVVRLSDRHLVVALRRKINKRFGSIKTLNWIDIYESRDNGASWNFLSKVADTDVVNSDHNGNPPSLIKLQDGRLCVTYGCRAEPFVMCAKLSSDNGKTWSQPIVLRDGARNWDFGYSRSLQRSDGIVVTVYYFATPDHRNQYIAATLWDPSHILP